jgi:hypothetical protein
MTDSRVKGKAVSKEMRSTIEVVAETLENYAQRGVFRGFSRGPVSNGKAVFRMVWHRDQTFDFCFDFRKKTMRFPVFLPNVPANSPMHRELKEFIKVCHSDELPEHRRIDTKKAQAQATNRSGNISLALRVMDGDCEYGARKLIHLAHEIFMSFLLDGKYFDYVVETFDLDPDKM